MQQRPTKEDLHLVVDMLQGALLPTLRRELGEVVKGAVHAEAMNLLDTITGEELRDMVRNQVQGRVEVTVKVTG